VNQCHLLSANEVHEPKDRPERSGGEAEQTPGVHVLATKYGKSGIHQDICADAFQARNEWPIIRNDYDGVKSVLV